MAMLWTMIVIDLAAGGVRLQRRPIAALLQNAGIIVVMANAGRLFRFQDIHPDILAPN
jgi:hypothetical protein